MKLLRNDCVKSNVCACADECENEYTSMVWENSYKLFYLQLGSDMGYDVLNAVYELHIHIMSKLGFFDYLDEIM